MIAASNATGFGLMMYHHGLRVGEAIAMKVNDVNLKQSRLWVQRLKSGLSVEQPIPGGELRAVKRLREREAVGIPPRFTSPLAVRFRHSGCLGAVPGGLATCFAKVLEAPKTLDELVPTPDLLGHHSRS